MDKQTHTPGPWELDVAPDAPGGFRIRMGSAVPYTGIYSPEHLIEWEPGVYPVEHGEKPDAEHRQYLEAEANARRIVAAVNAVEGIPTEALEVGALRELIAVASAISSEAAADMPDQAETDNKDDVFSSGVEAGFWEAAHRLRHILTKLRGDTDA